MMTIEQHLPEVPAAEDAGHPMLGTFWSGLTQWIRTAADYYDAAAAYEDLARLSDGELERRGLSRETLAREIVRSASGGNEAEAVAGGGLAQQNAFRADPMREIDLICWRTSCNAGTSHPAGNRQPLC